MPSFCAVIGCGNRGDRDVKSFFRFPALLNRGGDEIVSLSIEWRQLWINALKRADFNESKLKYARICQDHFISGAPAELMDRSNPDWVPNIKMGYTSGGGNITQFSLERYGRAKKRKTLSESVDSIPIDTSSADTDQDIQDESCDQDIQNEDFHDKSCELVCDTNEATVKSIEVQTDLTMEDIEKMDQVIRDDNCKIADLKSSVQNFSITEQSFENNDEKTKFYTGLPSFQALMIVFGSISEFLTVNHTSKLSKFQQLMLTLMKLRLALSFTDLSYRFNVDRRTVSRIYNDCLYVLYQRLKKLIKWPERENLYRTMPKCFKTSFDNRVTVIIDCFELFIERPSNLLAAAQTWSNYKHHNTVKFLIGIAPQGVVTFISEAWGGRVSDKFITENCGILEKLLPRDVILADRGFTISDTVNFYYAEVNVPAFTLGRKQISSQEIQDTRKIASVRIHVERVIGSVRQKYKILKDTMPINLLRNRSEGRPPTVDQIVTVCCALTNLCPSVVPQD